MPKYRICLREGPESHEGTYEVWNLPWERLVYDQRLDYQPAGATELAIYKVTDIRETPEGMVYDVVRDLGLLEGGDPKKDRPPYRAAR